MATPLEKIYDVFYQSVKVDLTKHPELDVNVADNLVESYLEMATYDYEENLGTTLTIDLINSVINEDIPKSHIKILGRLIYKVYLERELNIALQIANQFNKRSELQITGMAAKIVALKESLSKVTSELNRSFTRNMMKSSGNEQ